jgi:hypothetical protein
MSCSISFIMDPLELEKFKIASKESELKIEKVSAELELTRKQLVQCQEDLSLLHAEKRQSAPEKANSTSDSSKIFR